MQEQEHERELSLEDWIFDVNFWQKFHTHKRKEKRKEKKYQNKLLRYWFYRKLLPSRRFSIRPLPHHVRDMNGRRRRPKEVWVSWLVYILAEIMVETNGDWNNDDEVFKWLWHRAAGLWVVNWRKIDSVRRGKGKRHPN